jgi:L-asparaginase
MKRVVLVRKLFHTKREVVLLKKVVLLTTGGTIASKKDLMTGMFSSGELTGEELTTKISLPNEIEVDVNSIFQLPSMHISFDHWLQLREEVLRIFRDPTISGIVITHGTDTLEETAYFLDITIDDDRPIVVTGAQRSLDQLGSDVYINIRHAIYAACSEDLKGVGTIAVFNERIFTAKYVKKVHASNLQGFSSFGFGYIGIIDNDKVYVYQKPLKRESYRLITSLPAVDIIKCYVASDGKFIDSAVKEGVEGIVLEGVGRGQATPAMMPSIHRAISKGVHIVVTTSSEEGEVYTTYNYEGSAYDLVRNGVILGRDYDSKKARIKLAVLLASDQKSEIKKAFSI